MREFSKVKQEPNKFQEDSAICAKINGYDYLECSAKTKKDIRDVFKTATKAMLQTKKGKRRRDAVYFKMVELVLQNFVLINLICLSC